MPIALRVYSYLPSGSDSVTTEHFTKNHQSTHMLCLNVGLTDLRFSLLFGSISELGKTLVWLMWLPFWRMGLFEELKAKMPFRRVLGVHPELQVLRKIIYHTSILCSKRTLLDFSGAKGGFTFPRGITDKLLLTYKSLA